MKTQLITFLFLLTFGTSFGQTASSWNITTGSNIDWSYNFGAGTGNGAFIFNGTSVNSVSTPASTGFLPKPTSGSIRVGVGGSGTPSFELMNEGKSDLLRFQASSTATIGKFSAYAIAGATAITTVSMNLRFEANNSTASDWMLGIGNYTSGGGNLLNNNTGIASSGNTSSPELFGVMRFEVRGSSTVRLIYRQKPDAASTISLVTLGTGLSRGTEYAMEFFCNNTGDSQSYIRGGQVYTIPSRNFQLWINDARVELATDVYNFAANELPVGTPVNAFALTGNNSPDNNAVLVSKVKLQLGMSTLPVRLTGFRGTPRPGGVELKWQTLSEERNSHFEIFRLSSIGTAPIKISQVDGKGNSNELQQYTFLDGRALAGTNYYQLRQVDFDGKSSWSEVLAVRTAISPSRELTLFQNVAGQCVAKISTENGGLAEFRLTDLSGRIVRSLKTRLDIGENLVLLAEAPLPHGLYVGSCQLESKSQSAKVLIN